MYRSELKRRDGYKSPLFLALGLTALLLVVVAALIAFKMYSANKVKVPQEIIKKVNFSILIPQKLPGDYKIIEDSFTYSENTLVFRAKDPSGASIAFTEQKKPNNLDFEDFYKNQLKGAKTLSDVPYSSVTGKSVAGEMRLLSVVSEDTWLLASTKAPLDEGFLNIIASGIGEY